MKPIKLNIPGAIIRGQLLETYLPDELDQDILEIDLPNGLTIDVGWFPEYDQKGSFRVSVFKGHWHNQLGAPIYVKDTSRLAEEIQSLARRHRVGEPPEWLIHRQVVQIEEIAPDPDRNTEYATARKLQYA